MNFLRLNVVLLSLLLLGTVSCSSKKNNKAYIKVQGPEFFAGSERYYPVGVNMWYGAYLGAENVAGGRERLGKELELMEASGINNIRVLGASEQSALKMGLPWGIQTSPGVYDETLLKGLDFFLAELGKRKMYAVVYLNNYWQWSGGMSQYLVWNGQPFIDPDVSGDWTGYMNRSATFYSNDTANRLYREYIRMLVNRKNTITGIYYKDDPSIMSWQLANEPRPGASLETGMQNREAFIRWIDETAGYIKSMDSVHLVSTGNEGIAGCVQDSALFEDSHTSMNIDYLTFHLWPKNWGWFKVNDAAATMPLTLEKSLEYLKRHEAIALHMNKPLVLEEFGMERDSGNTLPGTSVGWRNQFYKVLFAEILDNVKGNRPFAGFNLWAWGGMGIPAHGSVNLHDGMEYMGDPLQEPQGLNSVFSSDTSTLSIIKNYAEQVIQYKTKPHS